MTYNFNKIPVDAGMILIFDPTLLIEKGYINYDYIDESYKIIKLENGRYIVDYEIPNTWKGDISGSGEIIIKSGEVVIGDPCYCFNQNNSQWDKFLDENNYGSNVPGCLTIESMGGDGEYDIIISFKKIGE